LPVNLILTELLPKLQSQTTPN